MAVGRFAPSPSGRMHLGNVMTALLAWCSVRSAHGRMLLRIEDLDPDRCRPEYAEQLKDDLRWLGLNWDEEAQRQSERSAIYGRQLEKLRDLGLVYPCYCTRSELHAASAPHAGDGRFIYAGTCRSLTDAQRAAMRRTPAMRLIVPDAVYALTDGVQGDFAENLARDCGDFLVRRSDGVYAYQLAVVTDDGTEGVSQIVRGADLLSSTPRQLYLQELLGFARPDYFHAPLLIAPDGRRLSKRERDCDLGALRGRMTAESLIGRLAQLCGLTETDAPISAQELASVFDWKKVKTGPITVLPEYFA